MPSRSPAPIGAGQLLVIGFDGTAVSPALSALLTRIQPAGVILFARNIVNAREFLAGLDAAGVIGAGKHFPGLGEGNLDSHHNLPVIKKSFAKLWQEDLVPYRTMKRELEMVIINHASYTDVTRDKQPASLSRYWITDVLRKKIGYRGLIVSDDLEMGGVLKAAPVEHAAIEFVRAGGDLCLICHEQPGIEKAFAALTR